MNSSNPPQSSSLAAIHTTGSTRARSRGVGGLRIQTDIRLTPSTNDPPRAPIGPPSSIVAPQRPRPDRAMVIRSSIHNTRLSNLRPATRGRPVRFQAAGDETQDEGVQVLRDLISFFTVRHRSPDPLPINLPIMTYSERAASEEMEDSCPICYIKYKFDDKFLQISRCKHWFHKPCLENWLGHADTCPVCRARARGG